MKREEIGKALFKEADENRDFLRGLKVLAINNQKYELAAALRDVEVAKYPESKTTSEDYKKAQAFKTVLNIADLDVKHIETAYIILKCAEVFLEKGGATAVDNVDKVRDDARKIFG